MNRDGKLCNQLHRAVPEVAAATVHALHLNHNRSSDHVISHAGGRDVLAAIHARLPQHKMDEAHEVLQLCGNMSSPSVFFALERSLAQNTAPPSGSRPLVQASHVIHAHSVARHHPRHDPDRTDESITIDASGCPAEKFQALKLDHEHRKIILVIEEFPPFGWACSFSFKNTKSHDKNTNEIRTRLSCASARCLRPIPGLAAYRPAFHYHHTGRCEPASHGFRRKLPAVGPSEKRNVRLQPG